MANVERGELVVGLDIGTTKICAVVGEVIENRVDIIGVGTHPSIGLRKGVVVNIESTVNSIKKAVAEAEMMAGCNITSVYVGIAGSHVTGQNSDGVIAVKNREIRQEEIDRVVENAKAIPLGQDQEVIHVMPQEFKVDGQGGIQDPLGMTGVRLEAKVHIVTGSVTAVHNIIKCCNRAGLEVDDVVLEPIASAEAVLTPEERELGVALIDIGGGTSDLAVFAENCIQRTFVLGIGGNNLTNDLSIGLRTPLKAAEQLKEKYGCAISSMIDKDQAIEVPSVGGRKSRKLSQRVMGEILEPRVEEMLTLINYELANSGVKNLVNAGVVLTGGTSMLVHILDLAEQIFDLPVRIGYPRNIGGVTDIVNTPQCATGVGLVIYGMKSESERGFRERGTKGIGGLAKKIKGLFGKLM
ncbi:MAG: cell division protein FtsA [Thermodesulfobacteriota bacterium]|jgi:cell division protein FtsA